MIRPSTASAFVDIALAALQTTPAPAAARPADGLSISAVRQFAALACFATALGCGLAALWMVASPLLGAAGGLLAVSAVLCAVGLGALAVERRARRRPGPSQPSNRASGLDADALLAEGSGLFRRHPVVALAAALLAGAWLGFDG